VRCSAGAAERLGGYVDPLGRPREVAVQPASAGSVLVLDRDAATRTDPRVVAHLAADEPDTCAALVGSQYLQDARCGHRLPRRLTDVDLAGAGEGVTREPASPSASPQPIVVDGPTCSYRLSPREGSLSIPELRWQRIADARDRGEVVSLREAIADLECYEPLRSITEQVLRASGDRDDLSITVLRLELERVNASPIVLNRRLREAVLAALERDQLSMSEIAIRCGRIKRDGNNESGETSWLARRLGLLPEGGARVPTPWVHSDVLGLIARRGLGISPREVEL
jgi:hypothetical protein